MAVHEWFPVQETGFYHDGTFKLVPRWNKCAFVLKGLCEKIWILQWNK
jgi:hypothetical protein